jgi:hypothetical protein
MPEEVRHPKETVIDGKVVRVGDKLPYKRPKLKIRPNAPVNNRSSFTPARKP